MSISPAGPHVSAPCATDACRSESEPKASGNYANGTRSSNTSAIAQTATNKTTPRRAPTASGRQTHLLCISI